MIDRAPRLGALDRLVAAARALPGGPARPATLPATRPPAPRVPPRLELRGQVGFLLGALAARL